MMTRTPGTFQRGEGFDIQVGRVLIYTLADTGFTIIAHRFGVAARGTVPLLLEGGVEALCGVFRRASIHHQHLAKTHAEGMQSYLGEGEVERLLNPVLLTDAPRDVQGNAITGP